ncbi:MAG: prephenate dehydrogenase [Clostridia bacterium]|nr:prephenate dehydrogenase [Clostridia bacterium]
MQVAIIGLGLIGASFAKAIKANTDHTVIGFDLDNDVLVSALNDKAIDIIGKDEDISSADLTIVSLYPAAAISFIKNNADKFKKGSVVIDTCGIKRDICNEIVPVAEQNGFTFIGAHPMAGKEVNGYYNSCSDLFCGASMILVPCDKDVKMLTELCKKIGFGNITVTTAIEHDRIIAYTSQLPHVLACAYISDPDAKLHKGFSAGSYKDVSRVATINAELWNELFIQNKDCLSGHIQLLIENLTKLNEFITTENREQLTQMLADGDNIKRTVG